MKALAILFLTAVFGITWTNSPISEAENNFEIIQTDTSGFDQAKALEELREQIKGSENLPSSEVFKNILFLSDVPAGRLLRIMEFGYARSLGVTCTHCHNPKDWSSDEKKEKVITREMSEMAQTINMELLPGIKQLGDRKAIVNCTTCHRGDTKPALNMN